MNASTHSPPSVSHPETTHKHSPGPEDSPSLRLLKLALSWLMAIILAIVLARYAFQSYQVFGQSMEPTLHEGDYLIISKLGATWADIRRQDYVPKRGDIVVVDSSLSGTRLIKRVIGLPDERVTIASGQTTVYNDEKPNGFDPYAELGLEARYTAGQITTKVPEGHVFLIGDNRQAGGSLDSRNELGPVDTDKIVGQLILRLFPLGDISKF